MLMKLLLNHLPLIANNKRFNYLAEIKSLTTSPARIKPATDGTKAILPGI
jgi:hypothetical protein